MLNVKGKILATKHRFICASSFNMDYKGAGVGQWTGFKCIRRGPFVDCYKHYRNIGIPLNLRDFSSSRASVRFWRSTLHVETCHSVFYMYQILQHTKFCVLSTQNIQ